MNETYESVISNVIANVISSLISSALSYVYASREKIKAKIIGDQEVRDKLRSSLNRADIDTLNAFLISQDFEKIVRQICSANIAQKHQDEYYSMGEQELIKLFAMYNISKSQISRSKSKLIFNDINDACKTAVNKYIDQSEMRNNEIKLLKTSNIIIDELKAISKSIDAISKAKELNIDEINDFAKRYRKQIAQRHGYIRPPNFDGAEKIKMDKLFVSPFLRHIDNKAKEKHDAINTSDFLSMLYRAVILGNPGGGKTTLANKICHDISSNKYAYFQKVPIIVTLRDYAPAKSQSNSSILNFVEATSCSKYQIPTPPKYIEYLIQSGRALVIFDGLDELLDTGLRREISDDVESFCNYYPSLPVIVTSREIGYEQAPLDSDMFDTFKLSPFTDEQVKDYAMKWFLLDKELSETKKKAMATSFLKESNQVSDLRTNPLLLSLMCNIYKGESYIPHNRPDVYSKCAMMLFERWDSSRGIKDESLPFAEAIKPTMGYIAHWIYRDNELQKGVTEEKLINETAEYLMTKQYDNLSDAKHAASQFIKFCRGRSWVLTDTGTTSCGERLFQFTHRTFLEYFTAEHTARTNANPANMFRILVDRVANREQDIVAQLSIQILNKNVDDAGDTLINMFINSKKYSNNFSKMQNILVFATRCLEFLVPRPQTVNLLIKRNLEHLFNAIDKDRRHIEYLDSVFDSFHSVSSENIIRVTSIVKQVIIDIINNGNQEIAIIAAEYITFKKHVEDERWESVFDDIFTQCNTKIIAFSDNEPLLYKYFIHDGLRSEMGFYERFGINAVFKNYYYKSMFRSFLLSSYAQYIRLLNGLAFHKFDHNAKDVAEIKRNINSIAKMLMNEKKWPCIDSTTIRESDLAFIDNHDYQGANTNSSTLEYIKFNSSLYFEAIVTLMPLIEAFDNKPLNDSYFRFWIHGEEIRMTLNYRIKKKNKDDDYLIEQVFDLFKFSNEQRTFLWKWLKNERSILKK